MLAVRDCASVHGLQDEMLPPEHMDRMHKLLLKQQTRVSWLPLHAGHMDAYEVAAQVIHLWQLPYTPFVPVSSAGGHPP